MINKIDFTKVVPKIDTDRGYWFVRTDSGEYYETYLENNFIAIGWNDILVADVRGIDTEKVDEAVANRVKAKIASHKDRQYDLTKPQGKAAASSDFTKILRFVNLRKGDVVVMPSSNSTELAFGIVSETPTYVKESGDMGCPYVKRKSINWVVRKKFNELDAKFYFVKKNMHSISDVSNYANIIDNVMEILYIKDDTSHLVLRLGSDEDDINAKDLAELISEFLDLADLINKKYELGETVDASQLKLNLQSKGFLEIKNKGEALLLAAFVFMAASCEDDSSQSLTGDQKRMYEQVKEENPDLVNSLKRKSDSMEVAKGNFKEIFE